jgi:hypothetical protein
MIVLVLALTVPPQVSSSGAAGPPVTVALDGPPATALLVADSGDATGTVALGASFSDVTIRAGGAGPIELGGTIESVPLPFSYRFVREEEVQFFEGDEYLEVRYNLRRGERDELRITVQQDDEGAEAHTISDILVLGGPFATPEGISVGSPLSAFVGHYPSASVGYTYLMDSVVLQANTPALDRVLFVLDRDDFTGDPGLFECMSDFCPLPLQDFRPAAAIGEIWIR